VDEHYRRAGRDRSNQAAEAPDGTVADASPEQQIAAADFRDRLTKLLNTLPPRQREILVLRLIVGLSAQETAVAVGLTPAAVRVTQIRALSKLRNILTPAEWA
jgi:RNA polymerase sigma-70 factor (ECF subfamily)